MDWLPRKKPIGALNIKLIEVKKTKSIMGYLVIAALIVLFFLWKKGKNVSPLSYLTGLLMKNKK